MTAMMYPPNYMQQSMSPHGHPLHPSVNVNAFSSGALMRANSGSLDLRQLLSGGAGTPHSIISTPHGTMINPNPSPTNSQQGNNNSQRGTP